jgi:hypothetical protein
MANSTQTKLSIANLSLSHLMMNDVANLNTTSNDPKIKAINKFWDVARDDVLSELDWSFATVTENLSQITSYYSPDWTYGYTYITENVANIWHIFDVSTAGNKDEQKFEIKYDSNIGSKVILSDLDNAIAEYSYIITDVTLWSHKFVMAFSYRLASMMTPLLTGDAEKALKLMELSNAYIHETKRIDSYNKIKIPEPYVSKYIKARS